MGRFWLSSHVYVWLFGFISTWLVHKRFEKNYPDADIVGQVSGLQII